MKINLDPKVFYGIAVVVVLVAALLVIRGANAGGVAPLPDAKMFVKAPPTTMPGPATIPPSSQ